MRRIERRLRWGWGSDADEGWVWGMKNIKEFRIYRHMLNTDSDGVTGQMQIGVGCGV